MTIRPREARLLSILAVSTARPRSGDFLMSQLSEADHSFLRRMRDREILRHVSAPQFDLSEGIVLATCADGAQFDDLYGHLRKVCLDRGLDQARIHPLGLNGGALQIAEESPLNDALGEDRVYMHHIAGARILKGYHTVVLMAHGPCGAASLAGMTLEQELDFLMLAKQRVRSESDAQTATLAARLGKEVPIPQVKVICLFHVDYGGQRRTYHVSREAWRFWYEERGIIYPKRGKYRSDDVGAEMT